jgi:hypothetical protein
MCKKSLSLFLAMLMIVTALTVGSTAFAKTVDVASQGDSNGFKAGDKVYFDCSACGEQWTSADAVEYINLTEYSKADNDGNSIVISERDTEKFNPIQVTEKISDYVFSYTFTEETAGATSLRFWRGSSEKMWNNSPLLTYDMYALGMNCVKATDLEGSGTVTEYGSNQADTGLKLSYGKKNNLYVHGVSGNVEDTEAWQMWQDVNGTKYFFLPSSADKTSADVYNTFSNDVTVGSVTIPANSVGTVAFESGKTYTATVGNVSYNLKFMRSSAECAVYVNNPDEFNGTDLYSYLCQSKSNTAEATGAVTDSDGNLYDTPIKKIKGRGNTSWSKDKKSFNITYKSALSIAGMDKTKKYSICANYQDDTLSRNRFLYDLGDEVGLPYSPDSRYSDFYINGVYIGSYQMCQKIEVGKDELISDLTGEEYLNSDGSFAGDFSFAFKIDGGMDDDDFWFRASSNNLTVISPELTSSDKYYNEVKSYISSKFTAMYNALKNNSSNLSSLIDMDSFAKIYLINELGKNWDAGVGSFYFVYKPDENGNYKFYASPTWDYDNSLGNANGVYSDLKNIGVTDYTEPTGYFVTYKGGVNSTTNVASLMYRNVELKQRIGQVWYESFVPAIVNKFSKTGVNTGDFYSSDVYYSLIKDSAEMNYESGWLLNPEQSWLADHSKLNVSTFDYKTKEYKEKVSVKKYDANTFEGVYNFCCDWLLSRSAYLSNLFVEYYIDPTTITTDPTNPTTPDDNVNKEHEIGENTLVEFYFDNTGKTTGDKLTEYGDKNGYQATYGEASLLVSMDGKNGRALEWSDAEYGANSDTIVPIMSAGNKNPWGDSPYIQISLNASEYKDMSFSIDLAGSKKAPANWKMQYSTDGENFTDISNTNFTITTDNRKLMTTYLKDVKLPSDCDGAENVVIRLVPTSTTTVEGGVYTDTSTSGELAINNIIIEGSSSKTGINGDLNLDGKITVQDATVLQKSIAKLIKLNSAQNAVADYNNDGNVNIKDVTAIQKYLANLT